MRDPSSAEDPKRGDDPDHVVIRLARVSWFELPDWLGACKRPMNVLIHCPTCLRPNRAPAVRLGDHAKCAACKSALLPLLSPVAIGSSVDFDELVRDSPIPILVDFWAAWCGPCRMVAPELAKLASSRGGGLIVAKVDTEGLPELAARFRIQGIPTMVLFRDGKESTRLSGAMPANEIAAKLGL